MANSEYTVRIRVQGGTDVEGLKKALEGLGATVVKTRSKVSDASKAQNDLFDTQKKGVIGIANSTRSFSKLAETIGNSGSSGLVGAYATLAANTFAVTAAFNALRGAAQVEQIFRGLEAAGTRTGLSLNTTAKALKEVTGAAISTEQAMRSTAQIVSAGFNSDAVERLGKAARDASFALGRNMTDSLDRLSRGVVKLEPELLDELGIMTKLTESNTRYAQQLGKSETQLTNFEKRTGFMNAVLQEAELKFGGLADSAGDTTSYDRLIAKFSDVSNTIMNVINIMGKPLAAVLAASNWTVVGTIALFASTLKNQLVPGLANASAKAQEAATSYKAFAKTQLENIQLARDAVKAEREATLARSAGFNHIGSKGPKVYQGLADSIRAGTASMADQEKGLKSLQKSYDQNERILATHKNFTPGTAKATEKLAENERIKQEIVAVKALQIARANAVTADVEGEEKVAGARAAAKLATREALSQNAAAASIGAASQLKLGQAWKQLVISVKAYSSAQTMASATGSTAMMGLRTATFAAITSVKALGVAFLTALPWIGLIVTAAGLLKSVWNGLKSDAVKELEKALESFNEKAAKAVQYGNEITRVSESLTSPSLRAAAALTVQSNAIREIAESYEEVLAAQDRVDQEGALKNIFDGITSTDNSDKVASFWETLGNRSMMSYQLGIRKNSKVLDLGQSASNGIGYLGSEGQQAIKTLNTLNESAPDKLEEWVKKNYGSWDSLNSLIEKNPKLLRNVARSAERDLGAAFSTVSEQVKTLQESFKQLESDLSSFYRSAAISTPYDSVVKSVTATNNAVIALSRTFKNVSGSSGWKDLLTGLDGNTLSSLSEGLQKDIKEYIKADATVQSLTQRAKELSTQTDETGRKTLALSQAEQISLKTAKERVSTQSQLGSRIEKELMSVEDIFLNAQNITRQYSAQLTLLQAQSTANSTLYKAGAAGMKLKIQDEERVRGIQKAQLQVQIDTLQASIRLNESAEKRLQTEIETTQQRLKQLSYYNEERIQIQRNNLASKGVGADTLKMLSDNKWGSNQLPVLLGKKPEEIDGQTRKDVDSYLFETKTISTLNDNLIKQETDLRAARQSSRDIQASIAALKTQVQALDTASLTNDQKTVKYQQAELELRSGSLAVSRAQQQTLRDTNSIYREIDTITNNTTDSISSQVSLIQQSAAEQKTAAQLAFNDAQRSRVLDLKAAEAEQSRAGLSADARKAADSLVFSAKEALQVAESNLDADLKKIDAQTQLNILQKTYFDTQNQGLQWQQEALSYTEKRLEVQKSLRDEVLKENELRVRLEAKRKGYDLSPAADQSLEIRAAAEAYKFAVEESKLKKTLIDLEFALLDAQRQQLRDELTDRRNAAAAAGDTDRVRQLDSTISNLDINLNPIAEAAKEAVDRNIRNLGLTLQTALTPLKETNVFSQMLGDIKGIRDRAISRDTGENVLKFAKPQEVTGAELVARKMGESVNPLIASNNALINAIDLNTAATEKQIGVLTGNAAVAASGGSAAQVMGKDIAGNVKTVLEFFMNKGLSKEQAAGIAGNFQVESTKKIDPTQVNEIGMEGIAQWDTKRRGKFAKMNGGLSPAQSTLLKQLEFAWHEMTSDPAESASLKGTGFFTKGKTAAEYARMFDKGFERSGGVALKTRTSYAEALAAGVQETTRTAEPASVPVSVPTAPKKVAEPKAKESTPQQLRQAANDNTPKVLDQDVRLNVVNPEILDTSPIAIPVEITSEAIGKAAKEINLTDTLDAYNRLTSYTVENLKALGPEGEAVAAVVTGASTVASNMQTVFAEFADTSGTAAEQFASRTLAVAAAASSALSTIQSVLASTAQAKEAAIDREIAAEQKRDGKSAESLAKIASLEKRKDDIARKQFNTSKKLQMAQAVISTAAGVAGALSAPLPFPGSPASIALAGLIGAMGAAQLAIIAGTSYQSSATTVAAVEQPSTLSIGKRGDSVDLAKQNTNVGGELGYLRGTQGTGANSSNYSVVGSAYGGELPRGYGNTAYVVGEKGPETITPETAITVRPASNDSGNGSSPIDATFHINALDASGVEDILVNQKGNLIAMLREAANANGQPFLESVNINSYSRPNKTGNTRL